MSNYIKSRVHMLVGLHHPTFDPLSPHTTNTLCRDDPLRANPLLQRRALLLSALAHHAAPSALAMVGTRGRDAPPLHIASHGKPVLQVMEVENLGTHHVKPFTDWLTRCRRDMARDKYYVRDDRRCAYTRAHGGGYILCADCQVFSPTRSALAVSEALWTKRPPC